MTRQEIELGARLIDIVLTELGVSNETRSALTRIAARMHTELGPLLAAHEPPARTFTLSDEVTLETRRAAVNITTVALMARRMGASDEHVREAIRGHFAEQLAAEQRLIHTLMSLTAGEQDLH